MGDKTDYVVQWLAAMADQEDLGLGDDQLDSFDDTNGLQDDTLLNDTDNDGTGNDDPELEAIKARVREMEEEAEKLKQLQNEVDKQMNMGSPPGISKIIHVLFHPYCMFRPVYNKIRSHIDY